MATTPRLPSAVAGKRATARTVYAHAAELKSTFDAMYAVLWRPDELSEAIKELVRLRNARVTACSL
jgi:uncharacterized protein with von Willebrand factor type A (vWA) domain